MANNVDYTKTKASLMEEIRSLVRLRMSHPNEYFYAGRPRTPWVYCSTNAPVGDERKLQLRRNDMKGKPQYLLTGSLSSEEGVVSAWLDIIVKPQPAQNADAQNVYACWCKVDSIHGATEIPAVLGECW